VVVWEWVQYVSTPDECRTWWGKTRAVVASTTCKLAMLGITDYSHIKVHTCVQWCWAPRLFIGHRPPPPVCRVSTLCLFDVITCDQNSQAFPFHICILQEIRRWPSFVPSPRPAFFCLQYGEAGIFLTWAWCNRQMAKKIQNEKQSFTYCPTN